MTTADEQKQDNSSHGPTESRLASDRLTRKGVADILGVSIFKVRSMEGRELHPKVVNGVHYFDAEEVESVAGAMAPIQRREGERTDGEIAALAFLAFDERKDLFQIVTELRVPPERVRALYREWREPDLEQYEVARRKRERLEKQQRREDEAQRRQDQEMDRWLEKIARSNK